MKLPSYYKMRCQSRHCKWAKLYLCECCQTFCHACLIKHIKRCEHHKRKHG